MVKWAIELGEHDITFSPRNSVKGQVLADFISEMPNVKEEKPTLTTDSERLVKRIKISEKDWWTLFVDGASGLEGAGAGLLIIDPEGVGVKVTYALRFDFPAPNNEAEYEALIAGLWLAHKMGARKVRVFGDSQLMVNQVNGSYEARDVTMKRYRDKVHALISSFDNLTIDRVPRFWWNDSRPEV